MPENRDQDELRKYQEYFIAPRLLDDEQKRLTELRLKEIKQKRQDENKAAEHYIPSAEEKNRAEAMLGKEEKIQSIARELLKSGDWVRVVDSSKPIEMLEDSKENEIFTLLVTRIPGNPSIEYFISRGDKKAVGLWRKRFLLKTQRDPKQLNKLVPVAISSEDNPNEFYPLFFKHIDSLAREGWKIPRETVLPADLASSLMNTYPGIFNDYDDIARPAAENDPITFFEEIEQDFQTRVPEGEQLTLAQTNVFSEFPGKDDINDDLTIEHIGDTLPPEGSWTSRKVYKVVNGFWIEQQIENARTDQEQKEK